MAEFDWTDLRDRLQGTSLYLIGMMGAGKSTVGRLLADALAYRFIDTDAAIAAAAGKPVPEIFAELQESGFRDLESQVLAQLSQFPRMVVATGGGIVTRKRNWGELRHGLVIWLDVPVAELHRRLAADETPGRYSRLTTRSPPSKPYSNSGVCCTPKLTSASLAIANRPQNCYPGWAIAYSPPSSSTHQSRPAFDLGAIARGWPTDFRRRRAAVDIRVGTDRDRQPPKNSAKLPANRRPRRAATHW